MKLGFSNPTNYVRWKGTEVLLQTQISYDFTDV